MTNPNHIDGVDAQQTNEALAKAYAELEVAERIIDGDRVTIASLREVLTRLLNAQDKLWPYKVHAPGVQQPLPVSVTMKIPSDEQIEHTKATADARAALKSSEPK